MTEQLSNMVPRPSFVHMRRIERLTPDRTQVFDIKYGCSGCAGDVRLGYRFCPWCGRPFSPGVVT